MDLKPTRAAAAKPFAWLKNLGPGLVTGAADDDPSGIATYSQAGAQFGLNMLWTVLLTFPLMVGIQTVSARIGRVTGRGLSTNIREFYPRWLLFAVVGLLFIANTINIAADVSAMGQAAKLIVGMPAPICAVALGLVSLVLQIYVPYSRYVRLLKWLTLSLLAYVATAFVVQLDWSEVLLRTVWPKLELTAPYLTTVVGVFGTTISPYLFFWQASQEVEEQNLNPHFHALKSDPQSVKANFRRIKIDTIFGMGFSNLVAFFIILTAAATLHVHGPIDIQSSADAAKALRPLAGEFAFFLFSLGIIGTGLLAVPVLAGSSAYAIAEAFDWDKRSLELHPMMAKRFYSIILVSTIIGVGLSFSSIDPMKALFVSAVINGVISIPIMAVMMLMAVRSDIMGTLVIRRNLQALGWLTVLAMTVAVVAMFWTQS